MSGDEADISSDGETSFEDDVPLPPSPMIDGTGEPFEVVLKGGKPWGFTLKSGPSPKTSIRVAEVDEHSQSKVGEQRHMRDGDYLLQVNGVYCRSMEESQQLINSAFTTLTLQLWRATSESPSAHLKSASFLLKPRELSECVQQQAGVQDDDALFNKSKAPTSVKMKPRQRRTESFHANRGGKTPSNTSSLVETSLSASRLPCKNDETSSVNQTTAPAESISVKTGLKLWATEHDLSSRQPVIMSASHMMTRNAQLVAAKSTPSLHQEDLVNPSKLKSSLSVVKSTPDIPEQVNFETVPSPSSKSPSWCQQIFPNRSSLDFSSSKRLRDGNSQNSGSMLQNSYSGHTSAFMTHYPQSPVLSFTPSSLSSNNMFPQTSDSYHALNKENSSQSLKVTGANTSNHKNYDRRSLPPLALMSYRPELMIRDPNKSESARTLTSMPVTHEEDEVDKEIPEMRPRPPNDLNLRPMYSPPAPPVRDISSLKYVTYSKNHEKYPSWPVSAAQQPQNLGPSIDTEQEIVQGLDLDSESDKSDKLQSQSSKTDVKSSPIIEKKGNEEKQRNQSDPGLKKGPKTSFYTTRKPIEPNYENVKPKGERFDEFCRESKPGYPPPKLDQDGHNYGDEKYNIPSPPERDVPGFDQESLVAKIAAVISPASTHHSSHKYNFQYNSASDGGTRPAKCDSSTSPLQAKSNKIPGGYFQYAVHAQNQFHSNNSQSKSTVDCGTSPLQSPIGDMHKLRTIGTNHKTESFMSPTEKSRSLIIRQMPYYNTSTQTEETLSNQSKAENTGHQSALYGSLSLSSMSSCASNLRFESSSQSSGISSMNFSDHSSAPMLRKLSEEYYRGKLTGMVQNDKRMSSASSSHDDTHYGSMKEAESYSSVVIHPHESSGLFGRDDLGSSPSLSSSRPEMSNTEHDGSNDLCKARPRSLHETHLLSASNLSTHNLHSSCQNFICLNRPVSASVDKSPNHHSVYSTSLSSSLSSRPHSLIEARSSGSHLSSGSSVFGTGTERTNKTRLDSDSVFYERTSPVVQESSQPFIFSNVSHADSVGVNRRESMKLAYGTYDEHHYATPYAHQRNTSDALSNTPNVVHGQSKSCNENMPMHFSLNEGTHLGHIAEEDPEMRWQDVVRKSKSLSRISTSNYENVNSDQADIFCSYKSSDSDGEKNKVSKSRMRRTASEQIHPKKVDKKLQKNKDSSKIESYSCGESEKMIKRSEVEYNSSRGESYKGNKSSDNEYVHKPSSPHHTSDSDLKRLQQKAVLDFVERKINKGSDSSEPQSPKAQDCVSDCTPPPPLDSKSIDTVVVLSAPQSSLADITCRYNYTKAQRNESLHRTLSIASNSSKGSKGDYVDMKRLENHCYKTEWSRLRSQNGVMSRCSLPIGSDVEAAEYVNSSPSRSPDVNIFHKRTSSDTIPKHILAEQDRLEVNPLSSESEQDDRLEESPQLFEIAAPGSHDNMVTAPINHNMGGEYPRRPPPPIPGVHEDAPPALPPRAVSRFSNRKSESFLLSSADPKQAEDFQEISNVDNFSAVNSPSSRWDSGTGTLREDAYVQQLRKQARRFSEQHKPISMQVVSTKSTVQVSLSQSYKQEPIVVLEAIPMTVTATPQSDIKQTTSALHNSPKLKEQTTPEPLQLPTPMKSRETEISMDCKISAEFTPPSEEEADTRPDQNDWCADDSYGSYKTRTPPREIGKYKRTVSDSNVIRAQQEHRLFSPDPGLKEIAETPNKPPRKKLEQTERSSPIQGQRSNSPGGYDSEIASTHHPNVQVPAFHVAEVTPVPYMEKSVAKSLLVGSVPKMHIAANISTSAGSFVSTVVQRPAMQQQDHTQDESHPSVKDRVKNIEVFSQPPLSAKQNGLRMESASVVKSSNERKDFGQRPRTSSDSLEQLESSVTSNDSFKDRLRPVVLKSENEQKQTNVPVERVSFDTGNNISAVPSSIVDHTNVTPPIVPSRTYMQKKGGPSVALPRRNSFQNRGSYDAKQTHGAPNSQGHINFMSCAPVSTTSELKRSPGQSQPEPQVPSRSHIGQFGQIHEQFPTDENIPCPDSRLTSKFSGENVQCQDNVHPYQSVQSGLNSNNDNSFSSRKTSNSGNQSNTLFGSDSQNSDTNLSHYKYYVDNTHSGNGGLCNGGEFKGSHSVGFCNASHDQKIAEPIIVSNIRNNRTWTTDQTYSNIHVTDSDRSPLNQKINNSLNSKQDSSKGNKVLNEIDNNLQPVIGAIHARQPSAEELECDKKADELAKVLKDIDKELSDVLQTERKKVRLHFLDGILPLEPENERRPRSTSRGDKQLADKKESTEDNKECTSPMPSNYYVSPPKAMIELEIRKLSDSNQLTQDIHDNDSLAQKKEELLERMIKKVNILKDDKKELLTDIEENESLGSQVMSTVQKKCRSQQEKDKYKSYIDDIDKIIRLLLKLSGLLARAENTIQGLAENTNEKVKKMTYDKRDRLYQQHEEAKVLKLDIDKRSDQVESFLQECMTAAELTDYHYYIKMKSKYTIQMQELEDKITLGNEQIIALQKSIPNKSQT